MPNENTHSIVNLPVKSILSFGPVGEILKKHIPALRDGEFAASLPQSLTFASAPGYFSLPEEAADALRQEMFAFLEKMAETNRREEAEFGVEVDHGGVEHLGTTVETASEEQRCYQQTRSGFWVTNSDHCFLDDLWRGCLGISCWRRSPRGLVICMWHV